MKTLTPITGNPLSQRASSKEASLYFHIPFCHRKCPYCHFYVLPNKEPLQKVFFTSLMKEWELKKPFLEGKELVSVYFGGGTPSLFPLENLETLLQALPLKKGCEITLEANPEDITKEKLISFRSLGINRMSLGVQSLVNQELLSLGRAHSEKKATEVIEQAAHYIPNLSIDLMYDLPGQTIKSWEKTLSLLPSLPITHLSLYNLTFEPHTSFFKKKEELQKKLPSSQQSAEMLEKLIECCENRGLFRYEISAFAKPGFHSIHNVGYWRGRPFLGLGPSAFSYLEGKREQNIAHLHRYCLFLEKGDLPIGFTEKLPTTAHLHELITIHLRLFSGVDLSSYPPLPPSLESSLEKIREQGWIERKGSFIFLTKQGALFYDSVGEELILDF